MPYVQYHIMIPRDTISTSINTQKVHIEMAQKGRASIDSCSRNQIDIVWRQHTHHHDKQETWLIL